MLVKAAYTSLFVIVNTVINVTIRRNSGAIELNETANNPAFCVAITTTVSPTENKFVLSLYTSTIFSLLSEALQ